MGDQIYEIKDLSEAQKNIIKASVPILQKSGEALTANFYSYMLESYPEVRPFFNKSDQKNLRQPRILAYALLNYAKNIDDLGPLSGFVNDIVSKHVGLQVKPEHYPIVGSCLIATMGKMLGSTIANTDFVDAWSTAYGNLAQILINAESEKYKLNTWDGFREFRVTRIVNEAENVKSVYFTPTDGGKVQIPQRGQYVCIRWKVPGSDSETSREYSLSQFPLSNEYRISVRLLDQGMISEYVHKQMPINTIIRVAPPSGLFIYQNNNEANDLVIYAGGIGITPLISIIDFALKKGRTVKMFYSNKSVEQRPFSDWFLKLKRENPDIFFLTEFFSQEKDNEIQAIDRIVARRLQPSDIDCVDFSKTHDFYLLGPRGYMKFVRKELQNRGVKESDIFSEVFGPLDV